MTDTYKPRRAPMVPGPNTPSISQRAVALREETAGRSAPPGATLESQKQALQAGLGGPPPLPVTGVGQLTKAVAGVTSHVGTIQKSGYNQFHKYKYPTMDDILVVVNPLMGQNGLMVLQNEVSRDILEGNRLAVGYEFTLYHESGEVTPPTRGTGMCIARDSKGNWDDKAIAKCHTNARKYYLMALFQIPTGDIPDNEPEDANQRPKTVPGPGPKATPREQKPAKVDESKPHRIILHQGAGADEWASAYLKVIGKAKSADEIREWDKANDKVLQNLSDNYSEVYNMLTVAVNRRLQDLGVSAPTQAESEEASVEGMPDPKVDSQEAMNWVATQLQQFKSYEAGEAFWNRFVAPREEDFDTMDWEMLLQEWQRFETRFPQQDPPEAA